MAKKKPGRGEDPSSVGAPESVSVRLSAVGRATLQVLAAHWGLGTDALLEMVLRQTAREEGLRICVRGDEVEVTDRDGQQESFTLSDGGSARPPRR